MAAKAVAMAVLTILVVVAATDALVLNDGTNVDGVTFNGRVCCDSNPANCVNRQPLRRATVILLANATANFPPKISKEFVVGLSATDFLGNVFFNFRDQVSDSIYTNDNFSIEVYPATAANFCPSLGGVNALRALLRVVKPVVGRYPRLVFATNFTRVA